jgi:hypothetical protein
VTDVTAAPPGWYPDPSDADAQRWWSGEGWTAHTAAAVSRVIPGIPVIVSVADDEPEVPLQRRIYSSSAASDAVAAAHADGKWVDPYRLRNPLPMAALVVACASLLVTLVGFVAPLPDLLRLLAGFGTGGLGTVALLSAIKLDKGLRIAVLALVIGGLSICGSLASDAGSVGIPDTVPTSLLHLGSLP